MSKTEIYLRQMVEITDGKQKDYFLWLINNGTLFTERNKVANVLKAEQNQCYKNSLLTAISLGFDYYEGYYVCTNIGFPFEHAFNRHKNNEQVIDVTAEEFGFEVEEWFGVKVPQSILFSYINSTMNGVLTPLQYYYRTLTEIR